ncbi:MAG: MarR family transcriptional regulator [Clostridia bacterium]
MSDNKKVEELIGVLMQFKKVQIKNIMFKKSLTHNENLILFILHNLSKESCNIPLSILRDKIMLAPSTITPIITSLEDDGFIERYIDKKDRRNIFLKVTEKGKEYTKETFKCISTNIGKYIEYMGKEDTNEIIRLISKTTEYFNERKEE